MSKRKQFFILIVLIIILIIINYSSIDDFLENKILYESAKIERVIDGDTVVIKDKISVRLLGINSPEKGELYYLEAKEFLENEVFNKTVKLKFGKERYDKYGRILAYIFLDNENVNIKLVEEGLANYYFPSGKDTYYEPIVLAWENCIKKGINLCESSENTCADCIILDEMNFKDQKVILYNNCSYDCSLDNWSIKDEGRKKFYFENIILNRKDKIEICAEDFDEDYVWTKTGDTLFLRDEKGKLVLWKKYP
jgi:hypothetical protein